MGLKDQTYCLNESDSMEVLRQTGLLNIISMMMQACLASFPETTEERRREKGLRLFNNVPFPGQNPASRPL